MKEQSRVLVVENIGSEHPSLVELFSRFEELDIAGSHSYTVIDGIFELKLLGDEDETFYNSLLIHIGTCEQANTKQISELAGIVKKKGMRVIVVIDSNVHLASVNLDIEHDILWVKGEMEDMSLELLLGA